VPAELNVKFYAHTAEDEDGKRLPESDWQLLKDHLCRVAALAAQFAAPLGSASEAELAGLLHDLGKYREEFQAYLRGLRSGGKETQHAIHGALVALQHDCLAASLAIAGHHAGVPDLCSLQEKAEEFAKKSPDVLPALVRHFEAELGHSLTPLLPPSFVRDEFSAELYTRLLFSCLVDADRLDTATWPAQAVPDRPLDAGRMLDRVLAERERKRAVVADGPVAQARNRIFDACLSAASFPPGFFALTVPTGGGKTLASMAFALAHAQAHGLRRIIVVIPYLSIIEQNAAEYRRILGNALVLESHSAASPRPDLDEEEREQLELVAENWDAPVIVTTSVQFIESLFAASPSRCRKLHRVARSVVVFDEVQTLPAHLLQPLFSVLREMHRSYGTTFVFSSATQPAFRRSGSILEGFGDGEIREVAPDPPRLFRTLRRVRYHLPEADQSLDWPTLAEQLAAQPQVLCVVNLTAHARTLWEEVQRRCPQHQRPIHLSSAMCPEHRLALIRLIRYRLRKGLPCRVVSTQLVEAGVDVDFPVVWRALGPLDSIVQVAGRCNREGRLHDESGNPKLGEVHVFKPAEHRLPPGVYRVAADQTAVTLASLGKPDAAADRLAHDASIFGGYFDGLYDSVNTDYARRGEGPIRKTVSACGSVKWPARPA
jgi:CRISPR-associated endonuclease/helicase Cas3